MLWRRLIGTAVLDTGSARSGLHLYAHCLRNRPGGVALIAINLRDWPAIVRAAGRAELYALTSPELKARTVMLNGRALALGAGDRLPTLTPARVAGDRIALAPTSVNFIALPDAGNAQCRKGSKA